MIIYKPKTLTTVSYITVTDTIDTNSFAMTQSRASLANIHIVNGPGREIPWLWYVGRRVLYPTELCYTETIILTFYWPFSD